MGDNRAGNKEKWRTERSLTERKEELRTKGHLKDLILFLCSLTSTQPLTGLGTALPESTVTIYALLLRIQIIQVYWKWRQQFLSTTSIPLTDYTASHPTRQWSLQNNIKKTCERLKKKDWPVTTSEHAKFFSDTQVLTMYFLTHFFYRSVSIS